MAITKQKRRLIFKLSTCITVLMAFFLVEANSVFGQAEKHTVRSADGTTIGHTANLEAPEMVLKGITNFILETNR